MICHKRVVWVSLQPDPPCQMIAAQENAGGYEQKKLTKISLDGLLPVWSREFCPHPIEAWPIGNNPALPIRSRRHPTIAMSSLVCPRGSVAEFGPRPGSPRLFTIHPASPMRSVAIRPSIGLRYNAPR